MTFLAKHLDELADRIGFLGAKTVADYEDRLATLMDEVRTDAEARR